MNDEPNHPDLTLWKIKTELEGRKRLAKMPETKPSEKEKKIIGKSRWNRPSLN